MKEKTMRIIAVTMCFAASLELAWVASRPTPSYPRLQDVQTDNAQTYAFVVEADWNHITHDVLPVTDTKAFTEALRQAVHDAMFPPAVAARSPAGSKPCPPFCVAVMPGGIRPE